ncbi:hypothetical protein ONE63_003012 [Megalurothrips usitatus]|uniref:CUB domain-containing protein n=1 Tax=Megalurothrips usitatus TaxID=439358 RepID=A0AAV7X6S3_9NEOP|nr:hypothetical protein ONE63_003012 [Megalurothrips usitatus]
MGLTQPAAPLLPLLLLLLLVGPGAADIELVEEYACPDTRIQLTCRGAAGDAAAAADGGAQPASIAVLEASFSARDAASIFLGANRTCGANHTNDGPRSIRGAVNHRCSGVNHCSFILNSDVATSAEWGPGLVHIKYACISGQHVHRYCSASAELGVADEGFLQSPGYPTITVGERTCLWRLRAGRGQQLLLRVLDLSLRARADGEDACVDALTVREGAENADLVSECGERGDDDGDLEVESERGALDVSLTTRSLNAFPSRGVLIHYKAVGCPSLEPPADGYLVARNESLAVFRCSVGFVFEDSERHARVLACEHGNTWNDSLSACVSECQRLVSLSLPPPTTTTATSDPPCLVADVSQTAAWRSGAASTEDSWTVTDGNATRITMAASGSSGDSDTVTSESPTRTSLSVAAETQPKAQDRGRTSKARPLRQDLPHLPYQSLQNRREGRQHNLHHTLSPFAGSIVASTLAALSVAFL